MDPYESQVPLANAEQQSNDVTGVVDSKPRATEIALAKNRISARKSRDKKKRQFENLEARVEYLEYENRNLTRIAQGCYQEIARLTYIAQEHVQCILPPKEQYLDPQAHRHNAPNLQPSQQTLPWDGYKSSPQGHNVIVQNNNLYMIPGYNRMMQAYGLGGAVNTVADDQIANHPAAHSAGGLQHNPAPSFQYAPQMAYPQPEQGHTSVNEPGIEQRVTPPKAVFQSPDSAIGMEHDREASNPSVQGLADELIFTPQTDQQKDIQANDYREQAIDNIFEHIELDFVLQENEMQAEDANILFSSDQIHH